MKIPIPSDWKDVGFWASTVAAVLTALAFAPKDLGTWRLVCLGVAVALPLVFMRALHANNAVEIEKLKNGNGKSGGP